ncbi:MAG: glycosyltransferase family 4 protein [Bacteroidetes bacterium]|nr:glycosyltransferase family 4 protein [Bacteroidota bacterium]
MRTIIFDLEIYGHHSEYLIHLMSYIKESKFDKSEYYFVVNSSFKEFVEAQYGKCDCVDFLNIIQIDNYESEYANTGGYVQKSIKTYKILDKYAKKYGAEKVILMSINIFIFSLTIYRQSYQVEGIMFSQFTRMGVSGLKDKVKYSRKYIQTLLLALNCSVKKIFILNDDYSCKWLNKKINKDVFISLPDPIFKKNDEAKVNIRKIYNIGEDKRILLHFGNLSKRKGSLDILESISHIDNLLRKSVCFLFLGKPDEDIISDLKRQILYYKEKYDINIAYNFDFIPYREVKCIFDQSDVVLLPYKNPEASSGVLGHAAYSKKIVIGTNIGLIGDLIRKYKLGILLERVDPKNIGEAIKESFTFDKTECKYDLYIEERSVNVFCKTLLST